MYRRSCFKTNNDCERPILTILQRKNLNRRVSAVCLSETNQMACFAECWTPVLHFRPQNLRPHRQYVADFCTIFPEGVRRGVQWGVSHVVCTRIHKGVSSLLPTPNPVVATHTSPGCNAYMSSMWSMASQEFESHVVFDNNSQLFSFTYDNPSTDNPTGALPPPPPPAARPQESNATTFPAVYADQFDPSKPVFHATDCELVQTQAPALSAAGVMYQGGSDSEDAD